MAYTRKQLVTCVSIVYLVFVTAFSGYVSSRTNRLSSPISDLLSGFTTALPIVAGLLLEGGYDLTRHQERRRGDPSGQTTRPRLVIIANTIILIYSSVVITLLGTHAAPGSGLNCGLEQGWKKMFTHKNSAAIRAIQDTFNCCGFVNSHDMAWPFPGKGSDVHTCEKSLGRKQGCLVPWRREEQTMAGLLIGVVSLVIVWQLAIIVTPTKKESWLHRVLPNQISNLISDEEQGSSNGGPRRAIDYSSSSRNYSDNVVEEVSDDEAESTSERTLSGGIQKARNAITGAEEDEEEADRPALHNAWT